MILGTLRRKASSRASSATVCKESLSKLKNAVSTPRACSAAPEEDEQMSLMPKRKFVHPVQHVLNTQICRRPFSSDSDGDIVEVVPFMGESITDGTLATFLKKPGDRVEVDEPIAQVETDKLKFRSQQPRSDDHGVALSQSAHRR